MRFQKVGRLSLEHQGIDIDVFFDRLQEKEFIEIVDAKKEVIAFEASDGRECEFKEEKNGLLFFTVSKGEKSIEKKFSSWDTFEKYLNKFDYFIPNIDVLDEKIDVIIKELSDVDDFEDDFEDDDVDDFEDDFGDDDESIEENKEDTKSTIPEDIRLEIEDRNPERINSIWDGFETEQEIEEKIKRLKNTKDFEDSLKLFGFPTNHNLREEIFASEKIDELDSDTLKKHLEEVMNENKNAEIRLVKLDIEKMVGKYFKTKSNNSGVSEIYLFNYEIDENDDLLLLIGENQNDPDPRKVDIKTFFSLIDQDQLSKIADQDYQIKDKEEIKRVYEDILKNKKENK